MNKKDAANLICGILKLMQLLLLFVLVHTFFANVWLVLVLFCCYSAIRKLISLTDFAWRFKQVKFWLWICCKLKHLIFEKFALIFQANVKYKFEKVYKFAKCIKENVILYGQLSKVGLFIMTETHMYKLLWLFTNWIINN